MSDFTAVHELDRGIKTIQCRHTGTVNLETGNLAHNEHAAPVQVSLRQSRDTVAVSVARGVPNEDIAADTTLFLSPAAARDLATAIREPAQIDLTQSKATMWLRMDWLHHDGPQRGDDSFYGTLVFDDGTLSIGIRGDGDDNSGTLRLAATLDEDEAAWVAGQLGKVAEQAERYEPPTTEPSSSSSRTRTWISAGIIVVASVSMLVIVTNALAEGIVSAALTMWPAVLAVAVVSILTISFVDYAHRHRRACQ